jgi:hypothetical protein
VASVPPYVSDAQLDQLIAWLAGRLGLGNVESPTVRWPDPLPDFEPDIANRHLKEWPAIRDMLAGKSVQRILLLEAESGYGKTELLHQSMEYERRLGMVVGHLDFRANFGGVPEILGKLAVDLGEHLPIFTGRRRQDTSAYQGHAGSPPPALSGARYVREGHQCP